MKQQIVLLIPQKIHFSPINFCSSLYFVTWVFAFLCGFSMPSCGSAEFHDLSFDVYLINMNQPWMTFTNFI